MLFWLFLRFGHVDGASVMPVCYGINAKRMQKWIWSYGCFDGGVVDYGCCVVSGGVGLVSPSTKRL